MDTDGVLGAQFLPLSGALATMFLLDGWWAFGAVALAFAGASAWYLTQSVVRHASWHAEDCLVAEDWDSANHAGVSVMTLGAIGFVQYHLGYLHISIAGVVFLLGAFLALAGWSE